MEPLPAATPPGVPPQRRRRLQDLGLVAGPALAALAFAALPDSYTSASGEPVPLSDAGRATAAVAVWMATWWLSEAIAVAATALLPLALFPLLGVAPMEEAAAPYAHPLVFLFVGGFLVALAMERCGLHRRLALRVLRLSGSRPSQIVAAFMLATALLSMWISNTAAAIMMLPVALSVVDLAGAQVSDESRRRFGLALLLGIAYAASLGGIATPIGTPPNLLLLSYLKSQLGLEIGFARWMAVGVPLVAAYLPLCWWLLTRSLRRDAGWRLEGAGALVAGGLGGLGPLGAAERRVLVVFLATCALWIGRPLLAELPVAGARPFAGLSDAGIAMLASLALFALPAGRDAQGALRFPLDWETALRLPWGILVLFGGGLSLAAAVQANGVDEWIGAQVAGFAGLPSPLIVLGVVTVVIFLTELTSNTATTATFLPILGALAGGLGVDPLLLLVPATLAASCAFMLPVATPPNAVVFASGLISIPQMSRAGFWLNWIGVALITGATYALVAPILGAATG